MPSVKDPERYRQADALERVRWLGLFDPTSHPQIVALTPSWPRDVPCGGCGHSLNDRRLILWAGGPFLCHDCWATDGEAA